MTTRRAKDNSVFHQNRYASSPEFERGLLANLVAKRCAIVDDKAYRELIWFIQYLSHQAGGLAAVTKDLIAKYADRIQTQTMAEIGVKLGKVLNSDQVRKIRQTLPESFAQGFLLKGETNHFLYGIRLVKEIKDDEDEQHQDDADKAQLQPTKYPASSFIELCRETADEYLEKELLEICLDPARKLTAGPWFFPSLISTLREYQANYIKTKSVGGVITALGKKVSEVLDYTFYIRGFTLMQGEARLGKTFAARAWCEKHPGIARFVEVPPSNDESDFYRTLARGLGLGSSLQYKLGELRERVKNVLLTGDLLLVLDEAHRLWPQRNLRYGFPSRIEWVMAMANQNVPICAIATPQFIEWQKAAEEKCRWNSAQLTGRISHYESLPADLSPDDLMAVAKAALPEANSQVLRALAVYARSSARYLAAIDSITKRARYIAMRAGRNTATTDDVRKAMQESVIPADTKLHRALESGRKARPAKQTFAAAMPPAPERLAQRDSEDLSHTRERAGQTISAPRLRVPGASLVEA